MAQAYHARWRRSRQPGQVSQHSSLFFDTITMLIHVRCCCTHRPRTALQLTLAETLLAFCFPEELGASSPVLPLTGDDASGAAVPSLHVNSSAANSATSTTSTHSVTFSRMGSGSQLSSVAQFGSQYRTDFIGSPNVRWSESTMMAVAQLLRWTCENSVCVAPVVVYAICIKSGCKTLILEFALCFRVLVQIVRQFFLLHGRLFPLINAVWTGLSTSASDRTDPDDTARSSVPSHLPIVLQTMARILMVTTCDPLSRSEHVVNFEHVLS